MSTDNEVAHAIMECFVSPNLCDGNLEPANIVDVVHSVGNRLKDIALSIAPLEANGRTDEHGIPVSSLSDSIVVLSSSMDSIAAAIRDLSDAVRDTR